MRLRGVWSRTAPLLPALLLVAVAIGQITRARTHDLSPWLGGGFGMFATTDGRDWRHVHVTAERPGLTSDLPVPGALYDLSRRARAAPSSARLRELARRTADLHDAPERSTLRIVLWRTRFDPRTLAPSSHALRQVIIAGADRP